MVFSIYSFSKYLIPQSYMEFLFISSCFYSKADNILAKSDSILSNTGSNSIKKPIILLIFNSLCLFL
jgi:hypothetical protein